jgi:hypothetical protein
MDYRLTGQTALPISAIANYAKECDAQGRDNRALPKYLTVH